MKPGDKVVCRASRGYHFTTGAVYTVLAYEASWSDPDALNYTWPAYVVVVDDWGKRAHCHAHRFEAVPCKA